jgi:hypothetical protein
VSCRIISIEELDNTIPVSPPKVNKKIKPSNHSVGALNLTREEYKVVIHLNTLIPVGIAITIVAAEKYARVSRSIPTVNM